MLWKVYFARSTETLTQDMEKSSWTSKTANQQRQLSVYNEGIYQETNVQSYCFIRKKGIAGRRAQEVDSCLKVMIQQYLSPVTEELILWSNSCGGQNRNVKVVLFLKSVLKTNKAYVFQISDAQSKLLAK